MPRHAVALLAAIAVLAAACGDDTTSGAAGSSGFLTLEVEHTGGTTLTVTLINPTDESITVVRPFITPHFVKFTVTGPDGAEIPFDGPFARLEPLTEEFVAELAPGESVSSTFDLAEHFSLPNGQITVQAEYRARAVHHNGLAMTIEPEDAVTTAPFTFEVP